MGFERLIMGLKELKEKKKVSVREKEDNGGECGRRNSEKQRHLTLAHASSEALCVCVCGSVCGTVF